MFIQVMQGRLADREGFDRQMERWVAEIAPGATGWLGATAGAAAQTGEHITIVRFESEEAARQNSNRPEQSQWWAETEKFYDEVTFKDYPNTDQFLEGGSDDAGFVQVIQGRVSDTGKLREMTARVNELLPASRPDVIGGTIGWTDEGDFTETVYFTSEAEARAGEEAMSEGEGSEAGREMAELMQDVTYLDLTEPRMWSA